MFKRTVLALSLGLVAGIGASSAFASGGTDRIMTGSGETPPAYVQVGPNQFERYEVATAINNSAGGTDGVMTGAETPLNSLVQATDSVQRFVDSLYPGATGYRSDDRVDP